MSYLQSSDAKYPGSLRISGVIWILFGAGGLVLAGYGINQSELFPAEVRGISTTAGYRLVHAAQALTPALISGGFLVEGFAHLGKAPAGFHDSRDPGLTSMLGRMSALMGGEPTGYAQNE